MPRESLLAYRTAILGTVVTGKEEAMAKGQDARKNVKQKPEKTLKEKRKEKKAKKAKA